MHIPLLGSKKCSALCLQLNLPGQIAQLCKTHIIECSFEHMCTFNNRFSITCMNCRNEALQCLANIFSPKLEEFINICKSDSIR